MPQLSADIQGDEPLARACYGRLPHQSGGAEQIARGRDRCAAGSLTGFKNGSQVSTVRWIMRASPVALATLRCFGGADAKKKPVAVQAGS
jgi:hypothetical protein